MYQNVALGEPRAARTCAPGSSTWRYQPRAWSVGAIGSPAALFTALIWFELRVTPWRMAPKLTAWEIVSERASSISVYPAALYGTDGTMVSSSIRSSWNWLFSHA